MKAGARLGMTWEPRTPLLPTGLERVVSSVSAFGSSFALSREQLWQRKAAASPRVRPCGEIQDNRHQLWGAPEGVPSGGQAVAFRLSRFQTNRVCSETLASFCRTEPCLGC